MKSSHLIISFLFCTIPFFAGSLNVSNQTDFSVDYEKFTLDNGLEVIFHKDYSNPVVAVALTIHIGSAREKPGRTGFAHLFEHLLFLESENLGPGGLDQMSSRIGGSGANGSTSRDRTNYFQTVPNDALEKMIWAEADKMGFFINTVSEAVLEKEKQVVKNEKRQGVDNAPYGHSNYVIHQNLYPEGHSYSWQVIGSLDDLQAATLDDVHQFYNDWYVPNNATLVIAGDFDSDQAREWIHKYFDEIPRGDDIEHMEKKPARLTEAKKLYHEDNFARLPELRMTWPGVELYHPDSYPLQILSQLLADGKTAPFYQVLVEEKELTSNVNMFSSNSELAGEIGVQVWAYPDTDLNEVYDAINEAFTRFESEGFTERDLERVKAGIETSFYSGLSSVLGKAFQLAQYNIFAGDPGFINQDIQNTLEVTVDDVNRVYKEYVKNRPYVATSFVPRGQSDLALGGSEVADVVIEEIVEGAEEEIVIPEETDYERTPSSFDRTVEPPYGDSPQITVPDVWTAEFDNGLKAYGIEDNSLPLVQFNLRIDGGLMLENPEKTGVSNLLANMLMRGTANRTAAELEEAIDLLGASINAGAGDQQITISGNTLARNYSQTIELVEEILMEPRWDERELELAHQSVLSQVAQQSSNPNSIATNEFSRLLYGDDHILSNSTLGTEESVQAITMEDLKEYYQKYIAPGLAVMHVAGAASEAEVTNSLSSLSSRWESRDVEIPQLEMPEALSESKVYFYDIPNASQSVLRIGYLSMAETDEDYYPATVMNYILGGGGFASRLTQELRERRGYTYGIGSGFSGSDLQGPFTIGSGVRSNVTLEAVDLIREILADYPATFSDEDLENTKSFLLKSNARAFETLGAKIGILQTVSAYGWDAGYIKKQEQIVENMTIEEIRRIAEQYADPIKMIYLVVGDARTQLPRLHELGFGEPVLLNDQPDL
ncbi:pitrilysin family protein [soil metagenome]